MNSKLGFIIGRIFFRFIIFQNLLVSFLTKRYPLLYISDKLYDLTFCNGGLTFVTPNAVTHYRAKTLFTKEVETIDWINSFDTNSIFWDIGANVGLYSVYAAKKRNCKVYSFEPSPLNIKCLSRNVCINNLSDKINIIPIALSHISNSFSTYMEESNIDGSAMNTYGVNFDFEGNKITERQFSYKIYGTNMTHYFVIVLISFAKYVKIDVDGIEHLILKGAKSLFSNDIVKEFQIEISENFSTQKSTILDIMKKNNFELV